MKSLKEKELYGITVIEEKDLTKAELEGNDYPVVYLKEDVVLAVAELRKEMKESCYGMVEEIQDRDISTIQIIFVDKTVDFVFDKKFGCEKPMRECSGFPFCKEYNCGHPWNKGTSSCKIDDLFGCEKPTDAKQEK